MALMPILLFFHCCFAIWMLGYPLGVDEERPLELIAPPFLFPKTAEKWLMTKAAYGEDDIPSPTGRMMVFRSQTYVSPWATDHCFANT